MFEFLLSERCRRRPFLGRTLMVHRDSGGLRGRTFYFNHKCSSLAAVFPELVDGRASQCHLLLSGVYHGLFFIFSTDQNQTVEQLFYFHQPGPFFRAIPRAGHLPEKPDRQSISWRRRIQGIGFRSFFAIQGRDSVYLET